MRIPTGDGPTQPTRRDDQDACPSHVRTGPYPTDSGNHDKRPFQSCENVASILAEAGSCMEKVIKTTCFLADMADFAAFNAVYAEYFTGKPARSCVAVKTLPKNVLCEIEAIALA